MTFSSEKKLQGLIVQMAAGGELLPDVSCIKSSLLRRLFQAAGSFEVSLLVRVLDLIKHDDELCIVARLVCQALARFSDRHDVDVWHLRAHDTPGTEYAQREFVGKPFSLMLQAPMSIYTCKC